MKLRKLELKENIEVIELLNDVEGGENGFQMEVLTEGMVEGFLKQKMDESLGINLKPNRVAQTIYIFYVDEKPAGIIKLREELTEDLLRLGGNVGYYIRKDSRGLGYGEKMLGLLLEKIREEDKLKKILITCWESNVGSARVIEKNGGILENVIEEHKRYWIKI